MTNENCKTKKKKLKSVLLLEKIKTKKKNSSKPPVTQLSLCENLLQEGVEAN